MKDSVFHAKSQSLYTLTRQIEILKENVQKEHEDWIITALALANEGEQFVAIVNFESRK